MGAIKNGQSRDTGKTLGIQDKDKQNTKTQHNAEN